MAFDPSVIGSIGENIAHPADDQQKALTIKDMMDREQMNSLQLGEAKKERAQSNQVEGILKKSDYSTPEGLARTASEVQKVSPKAAMDLLKTGQQYQSGQIDQQLQMLTLAGQRQDLIVQAIDPIVAQARQMKNGGASDLDVKAFITQQMPTALEGLRQMKLPDGKPALPDDVLKMATTAPRDLATLEGWESKSKAGAAAIKQRLEQFKADTQSKKEGETERHNQAMESQAGRKITDKESSDSTGMIDDDAAELAARRMINGESARDVLANYGRGKQGPGNISKVQNLFAKLAKEQGMSAQDVTNRTLEMKGVIKEEQAAGAIAGKIRYAENEIKQIAPKVLELSDQVPRGSFVPWNRLKLYGEKQLGDPKLKQLKAYLTTLTNSYDLLAARGGTDVEKRAHNRELLDAADSPQALRAAVEAIQQEATLSGNAADASISRTGATTPSAAAAAAPAAGQAPKVVNFADLK